MDGGAAEPFGRSLRRLRERARLTQEQLAERAGISTNAVSSLERGTRSRPYPHTRDALASALGLTTDERAAWDETIKPPRAPLPRATSSIVGRAAELQAVATLLMTERVVTLTGPGGVGKTRLALAVAERVGERFPDDAVFVPLAALQEPADVLPAVADALGLRELGPRDVRQVLTSHLRGRRMLVVLDNAEHLLDVAPDVAALVRAAPGVVVLVTSRAPLRIGGERVHPVPLLPPADAAALFAERALQACGHDVADEPGVIATLCARLDHLPLAIELVAARTRLLTPAQLLDRLDAVLLGTATGPRDVPAHQQTLRDTVKWSYDLLEPEPRALLRRLAVFSGGWTLPAAMAVGGHGEAEVLDLHGILVDNSLIGRDPASGEPRFGMLDTVRAFALEQLAAAGERDAVRDRHTAHFGARVRAAGPALWSPDTARVLDELEADYDNLRTAARHLLAAGRADELGAACAESWLFWVVRGHLKDPLQWVDAALAGTDLAPATRARLHYVAGWALLPRGYHDEAAARFDDSARLARETGMETDLAWTLLSWAHAEVYRGRPARAAELLAPAGEIAKRHGDVHALSCVLIGDAHVAIALGSMEAADQLLTANLPDIEARGAPWPLAVALGIHGRVAAVLGDHDRAAGLLTPSVRIFGDLGDTWGMAHQLTHVADVAALRGDTARAALLYGAVDGLAHEMGARVFHVWQELSDHCQARALDELGLDRYTQLRRTGRLLTPAEVVDLATGRSTRPSAPNPNTSGR